MTRYFILVVELYVIIYTKLVVLVISLKLYWAKFAFHHSTNVRCTIIVPATQDRNQRSTVNICCQYVRTTCVSLSSVDITELFCLDL